MWYVREREEAGVNSGSPNCATRRIRWLITEIRNVRNRSYEGEGGRKGVKGQRTGNFVANYS